MKYTVYERKDGSRYVGKLPMWLPNFDKLIFVSEDYNKAFEVSFGEYEIVEVTNNDLT